MGISLNFSKSLCEHDCHLSSLFFNMKFEKFTSALKISCSFGISLPNLESIKNSMELAEEFRIFCCETAFNGFLLVISCIQNWCIFHDFWVIIFYIKHSNYTVKPV